MALLFAMRTFGQKEGRALIDSLISEVNKKHEDTLKASILNTISYNYYFINADDGIKYGKMALAMSERLNWNKGIAIADKNIGNAYMSKAYYDTAVEFYNRALQKFIDMGDKDGEARVLGNIGSIYDDLGNYSKALDNAFRALKIYEETNNKTGIARIYGTIGLIYQTPKKFDEALHYDTLALKLHQSLSDRLSVAIDLGNIGNVYHDLKQFDKALENDLKALDIYEELGDSTAIANKLQNIAGVYKTQKKDDQALMYYLKALDIYEKTKDAQGVGIAYGDIGGIYLRQITEAGVKSNSDMTASLKQKLEKAIDYSRKAETILRAINGLDYLQAVYFDLYEEYQLAGNYKDALNAHKLYAETKDSVFNSDRSVKFANLEKQRALEEKKYAEDERTAQIKMNALIKAKKRNESILFLTGMIILIVCILLIARQRQITEKLLLNILPEKIAERLKRKEHPIADHFREASIIFVDIAGFTKFSETRDPKLVVTTLNDIFVRFDTIADQFGLEKIKTIGDCYMAVAGLPDTTPIHAEMAADMALEIKRAMFGYKAVDGTPLSFRIGIDCGPIVSGVIGKKKFIYDVWGDAVNTASRMESSGLPGEIQCTDTFRNKLPGKYILHSRGELHVKSKGLMNTWLLMGKHTNEHGLKA